MPKARKEIPELERLIQIGRKKFVRYEEGARLYSMGLHMGKAYSEWKLNQDKELVSEIDKKYQELLETLSPE